MKDDVLLVRQALAGGAEAFAPIVARYQDAVFGVALARLRRFHDAEDVSQKTFLEAYQRLGGLKEPQRLGAWLRTIAIHRCLDHFRGDKAHANLEAADQVAGEGPSAHEALEANERRRRVLDAIGRLSKTQRETVALFYISGYTIKEVAAIQEVPEGTIKGRLHDARKRLKEDMLEMVEEGLKENAPREDFAARVFALLDSYPNRRILFDTAVEEEIRRIGTPGIDGFVQALARRHWQTRRAAVGFLEVVPPTEQVVALLKDALHDPHKKVRKHAAGALLDIEVDARRRRDEFVPLVVEQLFDRSRQVRNGAVGALMHEDPEAVPAAKVAQALEKEKHPWLRQHMQALLVRVAQQTN